MKSILISIKPRYVAKILNGEKTIEIRKSYPKCDLPIEVYIYCTKDRKDYLYCDKDYAEYLLLPQDFGRLNGKVIAKFTLNEITMPFLKDITKASCLTVEELREYLQGKPCYAWHIDNLEIFDEPKELSEFKTNKKYWCGKCPYQYGICLPKCEELKPLTKAPQNWCYVEVVK